MAVVSAEKLFQSRSKHHFPCRAFSDGLQMAQITLSDDFLRIARTILRSGEVERNLIVRLTTL